MGSELRMVVKLGDMGLCCELPSKGPSGGTIGYAAPEQFEHGADIVPECCPHLLQNLLPLLC